MRRHLKNKHSIDLEAQEQELSQGKLTSMGFYKGVQFYSQNSTRKKALDRAVAKMIAKDIRPVYIVRCEGFRDLVCLLDQRYKLPSEKSLTKKILPQLVQEVQDQIKEVVMKTNSVAITTDGWTSRTGVSFLGITAHYLDKKGKLTRTCLDVSSFHHRHTSDNIKDRITAVLKDYSLSEKVICSVTDSANNIKKAIADAGIPRFSCFDHNLNLVVKDSFKNTKGFEDLHKKMSDFVSYLHRSSNANDEFEVCKKLCNIKKKLMQDVVTRWNRGDAHMTSAILLLSPPMSEIYFLSVHTIGIF